MHFLAHYYTELPANNPLFVAALAIPDLTPHFTKIYNSLIVKHGVPEEENLPKQQIEKLGISARTPFPWVVSATPLREILPAVKRKHLLPRRETPDGLSDLLVHASCVSNKHFRTASSTNLSFS